MDEKPRKVDLDTELRKHVKSLHTRIDVMRYEQVKCRDAHENLRLHYAGRIEEMDRELLYLTGLLDGE
jgi:hypothetical protein